jgi:hypothetical protein
MRVNLFDSKENSQGYLNILLANINKFAVEKKIYKPGTGYIVNPEEYKIEVVNSENETIEYEKIVFEYSEYNKSFLIHLIDRNNRRWAFSSYSIKEVYTDMPTFVVLVRTVTIRY